jgi:hypothetical protein
MKTSISNIVVALAAFASTLTGQLLGDGSYGCTPCSESCNYLPLCCRVGPAYLRAEFLYLRASEGGLDLNRFFSQNSSCSSGISDTLLDLIPNFKKPTFKWDSGFRIGAGWGFENCPSEVAGDWTRFWSKTNRNRHAEDSCCKVRTQWDLKIDYVDITGAFLCKLPYCFIAKPYVGVRFARINQSLNLRNTFLSLSSDSELDSSSSSSSDSRRHNRSAQNYHGIGPLVGLKLDLKLPYGLSIYLSGDVGNLFGHHNQKIHFNELQPVSTSSDSHRHSKRNSQYFVDAAVGVRWKSNVRGDMNLIMALGFEEHHFFNHNHFCDTGDLDLYGGTFSAALEY